MEWRYFKEDHNCQKRAVHVLDNAYQELEFDPLVLRLDRYVDERVDAVD